MAEVSKTNPTVMTSTPPVARASPSDNWSDRLSYCWYEAGFWLSFTGMTLAFSLRTEGYRNVPPAGPALLIANHQSFLDPVLVGLAARRHLHYLARRTLFDVPVFAWLIRHLGAVPIDQEGVGKEGIRIILQQHRAGHAVVVFPEGTRSP